MELEIITPELPKIIIKNIEAVNWSYSDVFECLEEFIKEMKKLGNDTWSKIESDDIVDYRIHISYNVIPKVLVEKQSDQKQQQLEQENKEDNNNNNNGKMEIEMVDSNQSIKLQQWLQILLDKLENKIQNNEKEKEKEKAKKMDTLNLRGCAQNLITTQGQDILHVS